MILSNKVSHSYFTLYDDKRIYLTLKQSLKGDYLAGLIMAAIAINPNIYMQIDANIFTSLLDIEDVLQNYIIVTETIPSDTYKPEKNKYGQWIFIIDNGYWLLQFSSDAFTRGFMYLCNSLNIDFRDFFAGPPFKFFNDNKVYYGIEGYAIALYNSQEPIPEPFIINEYRNESIDV